MSSADSLATVTVGTEETRLIVLRGNSASGKSSVAAGLRERFGRGLAVVAQDNIRRTVLRERDRPGAANIGLIDLTARYALDAGFHVVVEGILYADHYGAMLAALSADHLGPTPCLLPGRAVRGNPHPARDQTDRRQGHRGATA